LSDCFRENLMRPPPRSSDPSEPDASEHPGVLPHRGMSAAHTIPRSSRRHNMKLPTFVMKISPIPLNGEFVESTTVHGELGVC
jgi:hypothetical protein